MKKENLKETIEYNFPSAMDIDTFLDSITSLLKSHKFKPENTIPSIISCRDETVGELSKKLPEKNFRAEFSMRSLTGFPIIGETGFTAYYHHLYHINNENGAGLVIFSPHIGIDKEGNIGFVDRKGHECSSGSCGANHKILNIWKNEEVLSPDKEPELYSIEKQISKYKNKILNSDNPLFELTKCEFKEGNEKIKSLIKSTQRKEDINHPIILISGIHIDTPCLDNDHIENYFQVLEEKWIDEGEEFEIEEN